MTVESLRCLGSAPKLVNAVSMSRSMDLAKISMASSAKECSTDSVLLVADRMAPVRSLFELTLAKRAALRCSKGLLRPRPPSEVGNCA